MSEAMTAVVVTDGALRLEGMRLCAGCEEVFVLDRDFCPDCERIERSLEARRATLAIPHRFLVGTFPHEDLDDSPGDHLFALLVGWGAGLVVAIVILVGLWFIAHKAVAFVLAHGW